MANNVTSAGLYYWDNYSNDWVPYSPHSGSFIKKKEIDYVGGTKPIYVGYATAGTPTSVAQWRIKKITYDVNNNPITSLWAVNQIWDNRASLTYS